MIRKRMVLSVVLVLAVAATAGSCRPKPSPSASEPTAVPSAIPAPTQAQTEPTPASTPSSPSPSSATDTPSSPEASPGEQAVDWDDRGVFRAGLIESEQGVLDGLGGVTVYHIDIVIPSDMVNLQGHQAVRYTNLEDVPLEEVYFRLFPNSAGGEARISGLLVDGQAVESVLEFENSALRVPLPQALEPGEATVIEMDFAVTVPTDLGGTYGVFGYTEGVLALDEVYPLIPVYDDEGWNVEVPTQNGDVTYLDASLYVVRVTAPADLTLVATGNAVDEQLENGTQVVTFAAGPARDFYLAASERYDVTSATVGDTIVNSYAFPEQVESAEYALQIASAALASFNARLGPYPYTELDVLAVPMNAGGIEYPGAIAMALALYDAEGEVSGLPSLVVLESATAHEVAHEWFYNVVGNDQVDDPWLDEAIVQYLTYLYYVDMYGERSAQGYRDSWVRRWERLDRAEIPIGLSTRDYDPAEYGAIVYGRGPLFVEALAEEMGQETFDAFLRDYYELNAWDIGTPQAFRALAENHCDCDLGQLFEEWVYGP